MNVVLFGILDEKVLGRGFCKYPEVLLGRFAHD